MENRRGGVPELPPPRAKRRSKRPRGALIACAVAGVATLLYSTYVSGVAWELYSQCNPPPGNSVCAYIGPFGLTGAGLLFAAILGLFAGGLLLIFGSFVYTRPRHHGIGGALIVVTALLTIPVLGGAFLGLIAGLAGGILALVFVPPEAAHGPDGIPPEPVGRSSIFGGRSSRPRRRGARTERPRPLRPPSPLAPPSPVARLRSRSFSAPVPASGPPRTLSPPPPAAPPPPEPAVPRSLPAPTSGPPRSAGAPVGVPAPSPGPATPLSSESDSPPPWASAAASTEKLPRAPVAATALPPIVPPPNLSAATVGKRTRVWKCSECGLTNPPWSAFCSNCKAPAPPLPVGPASTAGPVRADGPG